MIVWNEFLNDARVLKEAETLQAQGCQVTVCALHTPGLTQKMETMASGVKVSRVTRRPFLRLREKSRKLLNYKERTLKDKYVNSLVVPDKETTLRKMILRTVVRMYIHTSLMLRLLRSMPDVVHAHDVNTLPTAWLVSKIARVPLVYDAHEVSTDREGYRNFRNLVAWVEKMLMPRLAATITTTDTRAKFFSRAYGIKRPTVLQNRPRLQDVGDSNRIRAELGLGEAWPIALYQGGLQQGRGLENIIDVAKDIPKVYFVFIGGGRLARQLKTLAKNSGQENKIFFIDTVPLSELPYYTASADIGLQVIENTCFNHFSTDSNKIFEYIMAGLPVISSNLPELRKLVTSYKFGLLVEAGNKQALKNAIQTLAKNKRYREELGQKASSAKSALSWERQEAKLIAMYSELSAIKK